MYNSNNKESEETDTEEDEDGQMVMDQMECGEMNEMSENNPKKFKTSHHNQSMHHQQNQLSKILSGVNNNNNNKKPSSKSSSSHFFGTSHPDFSALVAAAAANGSINHNQQQLLANTLMALNGQSSNQSQLAGGNSSMGQSGKIFHVDAYCYLCKKEFCNKYFLRTHLANKHKVFLNGNDLTTLSGPSMSKLQNDLLMEQNPHGKIKSQKGNNSNSGSGNGQQRSSSASSTSSNRSSQSSTDSMQHQQKMQQNEMLLNAYGKMGNGDLANGANSNANGSGLVEDFCELCNKQFCNKYYLKVRC
jgi:hypothetical protein